MELPARHGSPSATSAGWLTPAATAAAVRRLCGWHPRLPATLPRPCAAHADRRHLSGGWAGVTAAAAQPDQLSGRRHRNMKQAHNQPACHPPSGQPQQHAQLAWSERDDRLFLPAQPQKPSWWPANVDQPRWPGEQALHSW